jgi:hypothetical protein
MPELCGALQDEPLFHMSLGSKELFHSNLIGWLAERFPEQMARVFAPWLEASPACSPHRVRREFLNLDLVLEFPGRKPLVIENKMFSVPRQGQLDDYAARIDNERSLGSATVRALLSPCRPAWSSGGWRHISYRELAARLRQERGAFGDPYVDETVSRYAAMVEHISAILDAAVDISDLTNSWLFLDPTGSLAAARLMDGCAKLRADAVAALLEARLVANGLGDQLWVGSGLTNKTPFIEIHQTVNAEIGAPGDRVGWQLQGSDWRLAAILPSLAGRTPDDRLAREKRADELAAWFDFAPVTAAFPNTAKSAAGPQKWKRFDPDFVYASRAVPGITLAQVVDLGIEYARRAVAIGRL